MMMAMMTEGFLFKNKAKPTHKYRQDKENISI
jgi:hypothetical protein